MEFLHSWYLGAQSHWACLPYLPWFCSNWQHATFCLRHAFCSRPQFVAWWSLRWTLPELFGVTYMLLICWLLKLEWANETLLGCDHVIFLPNSLRIDLAHYQNSISNQPWSHIACACPITISVGVVETSCQWRLRWGRCHKHGTGFQVANMPRAGLRMSISVSTSCIGCALASRMRTIQIPEAIVPDISYVAGQNRPPCKLFTQRWEIACSRMVHPHRDLCKWPWPGTGHGFGEDFDMSPIHGAKISGKWQQ